MEDENVYFEFSYLLNAFIPPSEFEQYFYHLLVETFPDYSTGIAYSNSIRRYVFGLFLSLLATILSIIFFLL